MIFFSTFRKITVGGFVNELIKKSGLIASAINGLIEIKIKQNKTFIKLIKFQNLHFVYWQNVTV